MGPGPRIRTLFAAAWLGLAICASPALAGDADSLIDQVLDAYGGRAALARVRAYRMEGTISSRMQGSGLFVRAFVRPKRLRVVLNYPRRPEIRILDGPRGWHSGEDGKIAPAVGPLLGSMVAQAGRANLPWILEELRASARLIPASSQAKVRGIVVPLGPGLTLTAYVELATGRIVRSANDLDLPGMKTGFATDYADFRSVEGVLFPFREGNFASGKPTGETIVTKVAVNPPLTDADFRP